ncbi:hypothetical protein [Streptomyces parvulus]|uniref:hypothetical protein n=1 Tax=Streptomyces parvulus TaxID=146923 RepID=UPI0036A48B76
MIAAAVVPLAAQAPAQAAADAAAGPAAWTPQTYPLFSGEWVQRNVAGADRNKTPADGRIYTVRDEATYDFNRLDPC